MAASLPFAFTRITPAGEERIARAVAVEAPIAIEVGGIGYAVLMATPADLADLATGFALAERLVDTAEEVLDVDAHEGPRGVILRITVAPGRMERVLARVRHRVSESSCGLCGIENLEQALRPLPPVTARSTAPRAALFLALEALRAHQPLGRETGAVHGAALCGADGAIRLVREDVGRHNAFDKLIGAMRRQRLDWQGGFALLSARASYELVEKAVLGGCPLLVTVSMATSLAVERARAAGLPLVALARSDAMLQATAGSVADGTRTDAPESAS